MEYLQSIKNKQIINIARNALGVILGVIIGAMANMSIIMLSPYIITPPNNADLTNMETLQKTMPLMQTKHFIMPFLAHALGTLVGAFIAIKITKTYKILWGFLIGLVFFYGGMETVKMLPSPAWFNITDLALAYFPMAYIGIAIAKGFNK